MDKETVTESHSPHLPGYKTLKYFIMLANKLDETRRCHAMQDKKDRLRIYYLRGKKAAETKC